jgi:predicted phosphoribosyltransferase
VYFSDRIDLGERLADTLVDLRGTDAIVVCLKESSLMVAISMAIRLRAWVFPLFYEKIVNPMDPTATLGAVAPSGEFCLQPSISENEYSYILQEYMAQIEEAKREAMSQLNRSMNDYHGTEDPHILNNRNVVLAGDVMMDSLELEIANIILKPLSPLCVYGAVGNVTVDVSDRFRLATNKSMILDILPSSVMGEDHYFENRDAYSDDEKKLFAFHIAEYWT